MNVPSSRFQLALVLTLLLLLLATLWAPIFPREQWLQHLPTVLALGGLLQAARRGWLSNLSAGLLAVMLVLHIVGARWIYSYVPYETLADSLFGSGPQEWVGWERNHYDRLVHFAFGLLVTYPIAEAAMRFGKLTSTMALAVAWMSIAGTSAIYDVGEWLLAVIAAPEMADRYNGQKGDAWDAQKDMALAIAGSTLASIVVLFRRARSVGTSG